MPKLSVSEWSTTADENTDVGGVDLKDNTMRPRDVNNALREMMAQIASGVVSKTSAPFVILSTGQSNMANRLAATWTPSSNFNMWNFNGNTNLATDIGSGFQTPAVNSARSAAMAAVDFLARQEPDREFYLIDISRGGLLIADWGTVPDSYAMRTAIENNVAAALAAIGASQVDALAWWQGESDTSFWAAAGSSDEDSTYVTDFEGVMTWLKSRSWFEEATPTYVFGLPPFAVSSGRYYRREFTDIFIKRCVSRDPSHRMLISVEDFPTGLWDPAGAIPYIHMTADGYLAAGEKLARSILYGAYEPVARGFGEGVSDVVTSALTNLDAVSIAFLYWTQQGNWVDVSFSGTVDPTAASLSTFELELPTLARRGTSPLAVHGQAVLLAGNVVTAGLIGAVASQNRVKVYATPTNTAVHSISGRFRYRLASTAS